ncbi:unnamed protein product [Vicia faba]|uniref:Uncharacterized protein n=1 Tax=Vicia faba TaxID=3906 RepID=A0AAV1B6T1_VICFA|nr:unnamed protein product [Vicia faba]
MEKHLVNERRLMMILKRLLKHLLKITKHLENARRLIMILKRLLKHLLKSSPINSSRRRKRCVDKALLDDKFLDQRTLPIRDIILHADYKERLAMSILNYNYCVSMLAIDIGHNGLNFTNCSICFLM